MLGFVHYQKSARPPDTVDNGLFRARSARRDGRESYRLPHALQARRNAAYGRRHRRDPHVRHILAVPLGRYCLAKPRAAVNNGNIRQLVRILERQKNLVRRGRAQPCRNRGDIAARRHFPSFTDSGKPAFKSFFHYRQIRTAIESLQPLTHPHAGKSGFSRKARRIHSEIFHFLPDSGKKHGSPHILRRVRDFFLCAH